MGKTGSRETSWRHGQKQVEAVCETDVCVCGPTWQFCRCSFCNSVTLRFGNIGSVSVKEMSASQKPPPKTSKSPGTANVLDVNNSTLMFVGGLGGQIKVIFWTFILTVLIGWFYQCRKWICLNCWKYSRQMKIFLLLLFCLRTVHLQSWVGFVKDHA